MSKTLSFPPALPSGRRKRESRIIILIFLITLGLRLIFITQKNLWFDEIYSWHLSQQSFISIIFTTWSDIHPPLFYFILKIWIWILGDSPFSLRILPALCSSISVFFIYPIAKKILSEQNSIIVLILFALSPLNLFYSQEVRMSALNLLFNLASTYYLIRIIENLSESGDSTILEIKKLKYLYIIFSVLALYTHYFSIFVLFAHIIYIIYEKKTKNLDLKIFLKLYLIILIIYLIWIPVMVIQISRGQPWRYEQNISDVLYQIKSFVIDIGLGFFQRYIDQTIVNYFFYAMCGLILISLTGYIFFCTSLKIRGVSISSPSGSSPSAEGGASTPPQMRGPGEGLIILVFLIPLFFAIIVSFKQWIEFFRYLSIIIPFLLILLVFGFSSYKLFLRVILVGVFILINIYGLDLYFKNDSKNNDYRPILKMINERENNPVNQENPTNPERIFVYPFYYGWILDYYKNEGYPKINNVNYGWKFNAIIDSINQENIKNFWFVLDYHSFDSATYNEKLDSLKNLSAKQSDTTFLVKPQKVVLQEYKYLLIH